jgi:hypothetical protein
MKSLGRHGPQRFHPPFALNPQRQDAVVLRAGACGEPVDDFLLEHQHGALEGIRTGKEVLHDRPARGIRQIAKEFDRSFFEEAADVELRSVGMMHLDRGLVRITHLQPCGEAGVEFHQDQLPDPADEMTAQGSRAGTDLHDRILRPGIQLIYDPPGHVRVAEEILP